MCGDTWFRKGLFVALRLAQTSATYDTHDGVPGCTALCIVNRNTILGLGSLAVNIFELGGFVLV